MSCRLLSEFGVFLGDIRELSRMTLIMLGRVSFGGPLEKWMNSRLPYRSLDPVTDFALSVIGRPSVPWCLYS